MAKNEGSRDNVECILINHDKPPITGVKSVIRYELFVGSDTSEVHKDFAIIGVETRINVVMAVNNVYWLYVAHDY
ncbi:hypothetical protein DGG96_07415 [Legionella qingyii]|uniref:Uncharacterized protein n=1 Tax=Legionella qingyii TaxID=2184757 RepID=A0A317U4X2_9GAMM|nr:hypothetical protein DGG96_07415 [Legionella qingyii]